MTITTHTSTWNKARIVFDKMRVTDGLSIINAVVDGLIERGYNATCEYPGYVWIDTNNAYYAFGVANPMWGGEQTNRHGAYLTSCPLRIEIPDDSTDIDLIVNVLIQAITAHEETL